MFLSLKTDFFGKISKKKFLDDPGGGEVTGKGKVPKNNNFFSDPFPKLKEGISVKNNLKKTAMTKKMTLQKNFFASLNTQELSKLTS